MGTYKCHFPRCRVTVTLDGTMVRLKQIGWKVVPKQGAKGDTLLLCPIHSGEQPLFSRSELNGAAK